MMTQIGEVAIISPDGFYSHDCFVEGKLIAKIEYDQPKENIYCETQPWMVIVGNQCLTRFNTYASAESYVRWHYKQKTLPKWTQSQQSEPKLEANSHPVKCVLLQQQGFQTKLLQILVSYQTENAVMAMLHSLGLDDWNLVDWWEVQDFAVEPTF